jgi:hypothetical protein
MAIANRKSGQLVTLLKMIYSKIAINDGEHHDLS